MKLVKKTNGYRIRQRRDGRYAVTNLLGQPITGDDKVNILVTEKLLKQKMVKPVKKTAEPEKITAALKEKAIVPEEAAAEPKKKAATPKKKAAKTRKDGLGDGQPE